MEKMNMQTTDVVGLGEKSPEERGAALPGYQFTWPGKHNAIR